MKRSLVFVLVCLTIGNEAALAQSSAMQLPGSKVLSAVDKRRLERKKTTRTGKQKKIMLNPGPAPAAGSDFAFFANKTSALPHAGINSSDLQKLKARALYRKHHRFALSFAVKPLVTTQQKNSMAGASGLSPSGANAPIAIATIGSSPYIHTPPVGGFPTVSQIPGGVLPNGQSRIPGAPGSQRGAASRPSTSPGSSQNGTLPLPGQGNSNNTTTGSRTNNSGGTSGQSKAGGS